MDGFNKVNNTIYYWGFRIKPVQLFHMKQYEEGKSIAVLNDDYKNYIAIIPEGDNFKRKQFQGYKYREIIYSKEMGWLSSRVFAISLFLLIFCGLGCIAVPIYVKYCINKSSSYPREMVTAKIIDRSHYMARCSFMFDSKEYSGKLNMIGYEKWNIDPGENVEVFVRTDNPEKDILAPDLMKKT